jgi:hypothetical protein
MPEHRTIHVVVIERVGQRTVDQRRFCECNLARTAPDGRAILRRQIGGIRKHHFRHRLVDTGKRHADGVEHPVFGAGQRLGFELRAVKATD